MFFATKESELVLMQILYIKGAENNLIVAVFGIIKRAWITIISIMFCGPLFKNY